MMTELRIGLFGGSFDPIHIGHLLMAQAAMEEIKLSRIFFIPAAQSPFKPDLKPAPAHERLKMLRLSLAGQPRYEIDSQEILRGGPSYTIDTLRDYENRYPGAKLFYLIGADHIYQLPRWRDAESLASLAEFLVIPRPGEVPTQLPTPFKGQILTGFPTGISSSEIRKRVRDGHSIDSLVRPEVAEAIHNNGLYL